MVDFAHGAKTCIEFIEKSPLAVAAHDKQAWLDLFARFSLVEDPVGSRPCVSRPGDSIPGGPLSNFYDAFIAPNDIRFQVERDLVCGNKVWRDLDMHITLASGAVVCTPMHLLYELVEEEGQLKIFRLAAHWELRTTAKQQSGGLGAFWPIIRNLGPVATLGYLRALSTVGEQGKQRVRAFGEAFAAQDSSAVGALFSSATPTIRLAATGERLGVAGLLTQYASISMSKLLAAGPYVTASFELHPEQGGQRGIALFTINCKTHTIDDLELFWQVA